MSIDTFSRTVRISQDITARSAVSVADTSPYVITTKHADAIPVPHGANNFVLTSDEHTAAGDTITGTIVGWPAVSGVGKPCDTFSFTASSNMKSSSTKYSATTIKIIDVTGLAYIYPYVDTVSAGAPNLKGYFI